MTNPYDQAMNILKYGWHEIRSAKALRSRLEAAIPHIEKYNPHLAADWRKRLEKMPKRIARENIVFIMYDAYQEASVLPS